MVVVADQQGVLLSVRHDGGNRNDYCVDDFMEFHFVQLSGKYHNLNVAPKSEETHLRTPAKRC